MSGIPTLRPARKEDLDFSWTLYSEAVRPYVGPYIAKHFHREWNDGHEKSGFAKWWTVDNTSVINLGDEQVGWFHFEETDTEITLVNFCVASKFRRRGIGSQVLKELLEIWKRKQKPIVHAVLKDCPYRGFFERFEFKVSGE